MTEADRERERAKTDPTGIVQSLQAQSAPGSLLDAPAIDRLVRRFIADVLDVLHRAQQEDLTREAGAATVEASSRYYAGVMTGRVSVPGFVGGGDWLQRGLPAYLRAHHGFKGKGEQAIAEAFATVAKRVFSIAVRRDGHEQAIDRLVPATVALFGGMSGDAVVS